MNPTLNGLVISGTGALDKFTTVFRICEVTDVVAEDATVFVDLDNISSAVAADGRTLDHFSAAVDVILLGTELWSFQSRLRLLFLSTGCG